MAASTKGCNASACSPARWTASAWAQRVESVRNTLIANGLNLLDTDCCIAQDATTQSIRQAAESWVHADNLPEGVVVTSDYILNILVAALDDAGEAVTRQTRLVGFDPNYSFSSRLGCVPRVTTFPDQIGRVSVQRLQQLMQLDTNDDLPHKILVPVQLTAESNPLPEAPA